MPESSASNTIAQTSPRAMTLSVFIAWLTSTLSITTWKNSGVTRPSNCSTSEISRISPSRRRYLTMAGMNQVKSNFAIWPLKLALLVKNSSSPVQRASSSSSVITDGGSPACWISTLALPGRLPVPPADPVSMRATMKKRPLPSRATAGSGALPAVPDPGAATWLSDRATVRPAGCGWHRTVRRHAGDAAAAHRRRCRAAPPSKARPTDRRQAQEVWQRQAWKGA